jgi:hypothetical protein
MITLNIGLPFAPDARGTGGTGPVAVAVAGGAFAGGREHAGAEDLCRGSRQNARRGANVWPQAM